MVCGPEATYLLGCWRHEEKHVKFILISCGCVFLYTNMCKHSGDGVSTWAMFDGHIKHWCPVTCKSIYCIMRVPLLLFTVNIV